MHNLWDRHLIGFRPILFEFGTKRNSIKICLSDGDRETEREQKVRISVNIPRCQDWHPIWVSLIEIELLPSYQFRRPKWKAFAETKMQKQGPVFVPLQLFAKSNEEHSTNNTGAHKQIIRQIEAIRRFTSCDRSTSPFLGTAERIHTSEDNIFVSLMRCVGLLWDFMPHPINSWTAFFCSMR